MQASADMSSVLGEFEAPALALPATLKLLRSGEERRKEKRSRLGEARHMDASQDTMDTAKFMERSVSVYGDVDNHEQNNNDDNWQR